MTVDIEADQYWEWKSSSGDFHYFLRLYEDRTEIVANFGQELSKNWGAGDTLKYLREVDHFGRQNDRGKWRLVANAWHCPTFLCSECNTMRPGKDDYLCKSCRA